MGVARRAVPSTLGHRSASRRIIERRFDHEGVPRVPEIRDRYLRQLAMAAVSASLARQFPGHRVALVGSGTAAMREYHPWPDDALVPYPPGSGRRAVAPTSAAFSRA